MLKMRTALLAAVSYSCLSLFFLPALGVNVANAGDSRGHNKRFYYQIHLPETARSCQEEAVELANRFSTLTGRQVIDRVCKGVVELAEGDIKHKLYSIGLTYLAKREVFPYSAFFGDEFMNVPGRATGIFPTYAACLSELERQTAFYASRTGFRPVAATCQKGTYLYGMSFVLRIDGFSTNPKINEPKFRLYAFTAKFRSQTDDTLKASVEDLLAKLGGFVVLRNKDTVYYYSKYSLPIRYESLGEFIVAGECTSQLNEARSIFTRLGSKTVTVRCPRDQDPKYADHAYLEVVRDVVAGNQFYVTDSIQYYSYSECLGDRARVKDEASSRGYTPLGAICRKNWGNDQYEMQLFRSLL